MDAKQLQILQHTIGADQYGRLKTERNFFGTSAAGPDGLVCEQLVALGLMKSHGTVSWAAGETLYSATQSGKNAVKEHSSAPPPVQKRTRGQERYSAYLREEPGISFGEWLKCLRHRSPFA